MPQNTWADKNSYKEHTKKLAEMFVKNFEKYHDGTPKDVFEKGGPNPKF